MVGTASFLVALRAVQTLRHDLLVREAEEREREERARAMERVTYIPPPNTAGSYGRRYEGRN